MRRVLLAAALALAAPAAAREVPFLSGRVVDEARMIDGATSARLDQRLRDYEQKTGRQIVVLTVPSLEGEALEDFSLKAARTWKIGRAGENDGVVLVVARDERKVRIEVGYGLEGALTDAESGRIIRDAIVPRFRAGDFPGGIDAGTAEIVARLGGAGAAGGAPAGGAAEPPREGWQWIVFWVLVFFTVVAVFTPTLGWILLFYLTPFSGSVAGLLWPRVDGSVVMWAYACAIIVLKILLWRSPWGQDLRRRYDAANAAAAKRQRLLHGRSSGSGGGGFFGGFSGGGGGFSGGGGSFGGGGASGSW
jgi:uncharacterized protein